MNFKKQKNDWDAWVTNVEKIFRLKVDASSEDEVMVRGDFSCVLRFEDYLDKGFPNNPSAIDDSQKDAEISARRCDNMYHNAFMYFDI